MCMCVCMCVYYHVTSTTKGVYTFISMLKGGDFSIANYDGRTPLHVACCEGHLDTVRLLLENGASVHVRDRFNHTPLTDAIRFK